MPDIPQAVRSRPIIAERVLDWAITDWATKDWATTESVRAVHSPTVIVEQSAVPETAVDRGCRDREEVLSPVATVAELAEQELAIIPACLAGQACRLHRDTVRDFQAFGITARWETIAVVRLDWEVRA